MNTQLIVKTIKYSNKTCPDIVYDNPLVDRNIARALVASFLKILRLADQNSNINSNLRHSILENIRKLCQNNSENHLNISDTCIDMVNNFYNKQVTELANANDSTDEKLNMFLFRRIRDPEVTSRSSSLNAEVIQALLNLNKGGIYLDKLSTDVANWDSEDKKYVNILKNIWKDDTITCININDVAIKMKAEIERQLLESINSLLMNPCNIDNILKNNEMESMVKKCSASNECFQTCCGVLNSLFIMMLYKEMIGNFIFKFVRNIKLCVPEHAFSVLYSLHLQSCVLLLDVDLKELENFSYMEQYIDKCLNCLHKLHNESRHDFILLLSHFPQWFDLYFSKYKNAFC